MAKEFFAPMRMASQWQPADLETVKVWDGNEFTSCFDGQIVELGDFAPDEVYTAAYKAADSNITDDFLDINCRYATLPTAEADRVAVIDLANVNNAVSGENTYRIGVNTIGLTASPGVPVRARYLVERDRFWTGIDNCTAALTVGEYASVDVAGKWKPANTAPTSGAYVKVMGEKTVTEGVRGTTTAYWLMVEYN